SSRTVEVAIRRRRLQARRPGTMSSMHSFVPFRWDLTRRSQLDSLVEGTHPETCSELLEPLLPCAVRVLAFAGDADLVFVGRSPESLFDLLSGLLFDSSWFERLVLLHFSMYGLDWTKLNALHPEALPALRAYMETLALDPVRIAARDRPITVAEDRK